MTVQIVRYPFTVADYARMRETGILSEDDRVELIDGEVRLISPIGPLHAAIVKRLNTLLSRLLPDTVILSVQDPIQLNDYSEPQPDLAILDVDSGTGGAWIPNFDRNAKLARRRRGLSPVWAYSSTVRAGDS